MSTPRSSPLRRHACAFAQAVRARSNYKQLHPPDPPEGAARLSAMALDIYVHAFDEFDIAERVSAEDQIEQARRDVSA